MSFIMENVSVWKKNKNLASEQNKKIKQRKNMMLQDINSERQQSNIFSGGG